MKKKNSTNHTNLIKEKKKIDYSRIGALLLALFVNFFGFFGIMCAKYGENPVDSRLIWYYQLFFKTYDNTLKMKLGDYGGLIIILFLIGFFLTYREDISLYGVKYSLYFIPITSFFSLLWYWVNTGELVYGLKLLLGDVRGYLTIFITFLIIGFGSFLGLKFKQYSLMKRKIIKLHINPIKSE
ncbi:MAG: hypothetical protein ACTSYF_06550 [Promethearchaeota archaeon]